MGVTVYFWEFRTFFKLSNSTERPGVLQDYSFDGCEVVEPCSILHPTLAINPPAGFKPQHISYANIPDFGRYYFIVDWTHKDGLWYADLSVDPLGTWRDWIGRSAQYINRCTYTPTSSISDNLWPALSAPSIDTTYNSLQPQNPFTSDLQKGFYVVGIINNDPGAVGAVSYYQFSPLQFRTFCEVLLGDDNWAFDGVTEVSNALFKSLFNPFQYVVSCKWFPTHFSNTTATASIGYGWWTLGVACSKITDNIKHFRLEFEITKARQAAQYGSFLNYAPYSEYKFEWPAFGSFVLDPSTYGQAATAICDVNIDAVSGIGILEIRPRLANKVMIDQPLHVETPIAVPIQIAQIASDIVGAASSVGGAVAAAKALDFAGAISSVGNAINNALPQVSTASENGCCASYIAEPRLVNKHYWVTSPAYETFGAPFMANDLVKNHPGYIKCEIPRINFGLEPERTEMERHFKEGFFYV